MQKALLALYLSSVLNILNNAIFTAALKNKLGASSMVGKFCHLLNLANQKDEILVFDIELIRTEKHEFMNIKI